MPDTIDCRDFVAVGDDYLKARMTSCRHCLVQEGQPADKGGARKATMVVMRANFMRGSSSVTGWEWLVQEPAVCNVIDRDIDKHHDSQRGREDRCGAGFRCTTQHAVTDIERPQNEKCRETHIPGPPVSPAYRAQIIPRARVTVAKTSPTSAAARAQASARALRFTK